MSFFEKMSTADLMENLRRNWPAHLLGLFHQPSDHRVWHSFCLVCLLRSWEEHNTPFVMSWVLEDLGDPAFPAQWAVWGGWYWHRKQLRSQVLQSEGNQGSYERMLAATRMLSDEELGGPQLNPRPRSKQNESLQWGWGASQQDGRLEQAPEHKSDSIT